MKCLIYSKNCSEFALYFSKPFPSSVQEMETAINGIVKMREQALAMDRSEGGTENLLRYYLQLTLMDSKLPINENQVIIAN